jgi:hypothetical protein
MEYALPGLGPGIAQTRLPGVKFLPEAFSWDKMQGSKRAAIDFRTLDRMVKEYQDAGFAECMIGLKSMSSWASKAPKADLPDTNFTPKPEYMADYAEWVRAIVERYDGDGVDDMEGLKRPIRYYEIGVEFSTYEPEPVADYLEMLAKGYRAAHDAYADAVVMHAAFLVVNAFVGNPESGEYETAFAAVDKRIMYHSLDEIRAVLDHPELFDAVNFHTYSEELEATTKWLRYEMETRSYEKPLIISDTLPSSFIGWGAATTCEGDPPTLGIIVAPATEADRCRLADYFTHLVNRDQDTLDWLHGYLAEDMVRLTVTAAEQGIHFVNTSYMQDLTGLDLAIFRAGAGNSAWAGMVSSRVDWFGQRQVITGYRPMFYALQQLAGHLDKYSVVRRLTDTDPANHLYVVQETSGAGFPDFWIAWRDPGVLILPGDVIHGGNVVMGTSAASVTVERLINQQGQTTPTTETLPVQDGSVSIPLTPTPVFIRTVQ